uniref:Uncharacterized protein n=1 Tax=Myotis myotis TaxID=51298 RepID=A0A7J7TIH4_MYOMY|nr:hypothetical protein mMyoMyo1_009014 [Myotis myotis]
MRLRPVARRGVQGAPGGAPQGRPARQPHTLPWRVRPRGLGCRLACDVGVGVGVRVRVRGAPAEGRESWPCSSSDCERANLPSRRPWGWAPGTWSPVSAQPGSGGRHPRGLGAHCSRSRFSKRGADGEARLTPHCAHARATEIRALEGLARGEHAGQPGGDPWAPRALTDGGRRHASAGRGGQQDRPTNCLETVNNFVSRGSRHHLETTFGNRCACCRRRETGH